MGDFEAPKLSDANFHLRFDFVAPFFPSSGFLDGSLQRSGLEGWAMSPLTSSRSSSHLQGMMSR